MTDQLTHVKRRWLYIPFVVAAIVVVAYTMLWSAGAAQMKSAVLDWIEDQRDAGLTVNYSDIVSDGFPFFLRVHIDDAEIASTNGWRWRGERLSLDALPYDLNRLIFSPQGEQVLTVEGFGEWRVIAADLRASIANDKARGWVFSMTVSEASAYRDADGASASLQSLIFDLAPDEGVETTLVLNLAASNFSAEVNGERYSLAELKTMTSASHSNLLLVSDGAALWRQKGGALTISGFFADIEGARFSVSGAIHLDANDYPAGAINAEIINPVNFARLLGKAGAISHAEAEAAAAGLSLMALAGGGKIAAPIDLKGGKAQIAGVKIADLPRVQ